jgi:antitoxin ParD1/3/4
MSTIQLELPEPIRQFVDEQVAKEGFGGPGDYIQSILRDLQLRKAQEDLDAALLQGLDSPARELRSEEWADMRREALQRITSVTTR